MQCPKCGKTGFVTLSGKRYCSNCGAKLDTSAVPTATMSDIKPKGKPLDLRSATPTPTKSAAAVTAAVAGKPAGQFHGQQRSGAAVLDLRTKSALAAAAPSAPVATAPPTPAPVVTAPPPPVVKPTPTITPKKSVVAQSAAAQPVSAAPAPAAASSQSPLINKYPNRPGATVMPSAVAAQVDSMKAQSATAPLPAQPQSPALRQALKAAKQSTTTPSVLKIGAALVAIGIMGGVVWLQNSPKLAFRNAAAQAGIEASLPTYIPSSYHQAGPVSASPGALTINFTSPGTSQPLKITQRASDWDANALRENYVSTQSTNFLAVQGQGLTIYLYGSQADWINHGVWYQLTGTSKLGREDVLKIAYGL